ncbi:uncharacterized protein LOC144885036 [Branchiostoma floridae x Branchiostoma japonicum]
MVSMEKTSATEMCSACGRPETKHAEAGNRFGAECIWRLRAPPRRRRASIRAVDSQESPGGEKHATTAPEAAAQESSSSHVVSEYEIARLQAERDRLLRQYEVNRLQQEIARLRAALGTSAADLDPASRTLGATVRDLSAPVPANLIAPPPIALQDINQQPQMQSALKKLSASVNLLSNILSHSTGKDHYYGDTNDTDQWSPTSDFIVKNGSNPNTGPSRSGDLGKRPALQRLRIDTVRNWLENRHVDEDHSGSTDSGVFRGAAIYPTSQFEGLDVNINEGQRHRISRVTGLLRRRTLHNERVQYWNAKIMKRQRTQSGIHQWIERHHVRHTVIDNERRHSYDSGGFPDAAMFNSSMSSQFGGSMPDLNIKYKSKHHHGSLLTRPAESTRKLGELGAIGEGVEEHLTEDVNDVFVEAGNGRAIRSRETSKEAEKKTIDLQKKNAHGANRKEPWTRHHKLKRQKSVDSPVSSSDDHVPYEEKQYWQHKSDLHRGFKQEKRIDKVKSDIPVSEGQQVLKRSPTQSHQPTKRGVKSREKGLKKPPVRGVSTADIVAEFLWGEKRPTADSKPTHKSKDEKDLPSDKHPEKQWKISDKKATQEHRNSKSPRSPSRRSRRPSGSPTRRPSRPAGSPTRSPRRHHSPHKREKSSTGHTGESVSAKAKLQDVIAKKTFKTGDDVVIGKTKSGNTSQLKGWTSPMPRAPTEEHAEGSGSANVTLHDVSASKTNETVKDVVKTPDKDTATEFFEGFKGFFSNSLGGDEEEKKDPTETDVHDSGSIFSSIFGSSEQRGNKNNADESGSSLWGLLGKSDSDPALMNQISEKGEAGEGKSPISGLLGSKVDSDPAMMSQMSEKGGDNYEGKSSIWGLLGSKSGNDPAVMSQMSEKGEDGEGKPALWGLLGSKSDNDPVFMSQMSEKGGKEGGGKPAISGLLGSKMDHNPATMSQMSEKKEGDGERGSSLWGILASKSGDPALMSQMSEKGKKVQEESSFWDFLPFGKSDEPAPPQWKTRGPPEASRKGGKPVRRGDNPVLDFINDMFKDL